MTVVWPPGSAIYGPLLGDPEVAQHLSDAAHLRAILRVEAALAAAQAQVTADAADAARARTVAATLDAMAPPDPAALGPGTLATGMPIPALVRDVRARLDPAVADHLHRGATSQDVLDTALILQLRPVLDILAGRLDRVIADLAGLADRHRRTVIAARTRFQPAVPMPYGLRCAQWLMPLVDHRATLDPLRARLARLQLGGAAGTLSALGPQALDVVARMATDLGLAAADLPWHAARERLVELGQWLTRMTGSLGKIAQDLILARQEGIAGPPTDGSAHGGSSTMPQKSNPVIAETVLAIARTLPAQAATLAQAQLHAQERDGSAWTQEWLCLGPLLTLAGCALAHGPALLAETRPRPNDAGTGDGLILAEAASFALAAHMPLAEAQALVRRAAQTAAADAPAHLIDRLATLTEAPVDWTALKDPAASLGVADVLIDRALAAARYRR